MSLPTREEILMDEYGREEEVECGRCGGTKRIVVDTRKRRRYDEEPDEYVCDACRRASKVIVTDWAEKEIAKRKLNLAEMLAVFRASGRPTLNLQVAEDLYVCVSNTSGQTFVFMSTVEDTGKPEVTIPLTLEGQ